MKATRIFSRGLCPMVLALVLAVPAFAQDAAKPFSGSKDSSVGRSLFEAWKAQHRAGPQAAAGPVMNGAVVPDVGRASMVINNAGTVLYTKNFLGAGVTCDVRRIQAQNNWTANTAFAAGAVVRPTAAPLQPNGFDGFNFQANNGGTSGLTEPTWPTSGVGATVNDNGITWTAIAFDPANFVGCTPMQIVSRASGGTETVLAQEGDTLADGSQLAGWAEFMAMNDAGVGAFRAALAGYPFSDRDDEGESGIFTAGPGAGALTRVAATSTTIGGRTICGFSAMVGINGAGQVVFDTYPGPLANGCDENNHGIVRFTPGGPGNQLLVQQGSTVGTPAATVIGFGKDDHSAPGTCVGCEYSNIDGLINASGHVPIVLNLSDGTQGVFVFTGPGVATQAVRLPTGSIGPRLSINNGDQVVYRANTGGVDHLFRFTPPATITMIASVGDVVNGHTISSLGAFTDINNSGSVVFQAQVDAGGQDAFYYWDGSVTQVALGPLNSLAAEMISVNDSNQVAYVTGSTGPEGPDLGSEGHETGAIFFWTKAGGSVKAVQVGDVINGNAVTAIYAQHTSFVKRQFSQAGCLATAYMVLNDDPEFDCTEGGPCNPPLQKGGQLFISCAAGVCPTITLAPPTLPGATQGAAYSQMIVASGGQAAYTYAVTAGALPGGLTLTTGGLLSGTPAAAGTFNFTVTATDANACPGSQAYSLVVGGPTQVTIVLNPPSRTVQVGSTTNLTVSINIPQSTDTVVTLSSSNPAIATVPATVTILANQTSALFTVNGVAVGGPVTITASLPSSFGAPPATASVTVLAAAAAAVPTLSGWSLAILGIILAAAGLLLMKK